MSDDLTARAEQYLREWDIAFQRGALTFTEDAVLIRELFAALTAARQAREQAEQERDRLLLILRIVQGKVAIGAGSLSIADIERIDNALAPQDGPP